MTRSTGGYWTQRHVICQSLGTPKLAMTAGAVECDGKTFLLMSFQIISSVIGFLAMLAYVTDLVLIVDTVLVA